MSVLGDLSVGGRRSCFSRHISPPSLSFSPNDDGKEPQPAVVTQARGQPPGGGGGHPGCPRLAACLQTDTSFPQPVSLAWK